MRRIVLLFSLVSIFTLNAKAADLCEDSSPQVFAPADVVVSCDYWFSLGMLDDPNNAMFGRFVYGQSKIQKLKTIDRLCPGWCEYDRKTKYDPTIGAGEKACEFYQQYYNPALPGKKYPLVWGTDGYVTNWTSAVTIEVDDRRFCGTGLIVRRFIIEDRGLQYYDEQNIWIVDCNPFYVSTECTDPDDDIEWPLNCQQPDPLDGCFADLSPRNPQLGRPKIVVGADDQCNMIAIDYQDDTLTVEPDACLKLIRTWRVVDWCKYHPLSNPNQGRWEYVQVIKVRDKLDPEIECEIGECLPANADSLGNCFGQIELTARGLDSCTAEDRLRFEYKIDLFNDGTGPLGTHDLQVGPLSRLDEVPVIQENEFALFPDSVLNASGIYPLGVHRIKWFVEDGCGNVNLCDTLFEIKDCKEPTPYCKPGLITVVMPSTQSITVNARDLDDGSFDNCSSTLLFSFSSDVNDTTRVYDCDSLGERSVQLWVTDEEGNQDYCETKYIIQDGSGHCDSTGNVVSFTVLQNMKGENIQLNDVHFDVYVDQQMVYTQPVTSNNWTFDFSPYAGATEVEVALSSGPATLNGVTTDDLIAMYRHLLGHDAFDSYHQLWASDFTGDDKLTSADISALRSLLIDPTGSIPRGFMQDYMFAPENHIDFHNARGLANPKRHTVTLGMKGQNWIFRPIKMGQVIN